MKEEVLSFKEKVLLRLKDMNYKPATNIVELIDNRMVIIDLIDEIMNEEFENAIST